MPDTSPTLPARSLWICIPLGLLLAAAVFWLWGLSLWSAAIAALALVCPSLIAWGVYEIRRG